MRLQTQIAIGLCVAIFMLVAAVDGLEPSATNSDTQNYVAAPKVEQESDIATLAMMCENAITPQLKNPRSFDIDMHQTRVFDHEGSIVLDMFYYAENSYGATSINEAFCEFTQSGNLINVMPVPQ